MTDDLLAAVRAVLAVGLDAHDRDSLRRGDSPRHHHAAPGVWSAESKPALAGRPCAECAAWQRLWRLAGGES